MATLSLENLVKIYNGRQVVNSVNMKIKNNSVVGLLGPNGAGKTTLMKILYGMQPADEGRMVVNGQ